jgi:hypothetical protein
MERRRISTPGNAGSNPAESATVASDGRVAEPMEQIALTPDQELDAPRDHHYQYGELTRRVAGAGC